MNAASLRLLILNDSHTEAERLISLLRNAGRHPRAQHAESEDALVKLLQNQSWDLLIALDTTTNLPPATALAVLRRLNVDVPVLLLTEDENPSTRIEGLRAGAADVIRLDDDQHLLLVVNRELLNRQARSDMRSLERSLKELERRNQELLDTSKNGIAFEQDGLFLYVNDSFAELMGYPSRDDLDCVPIIDIIHPSQQDAVKSFLKEFALKKGDLDTDEMTWQVTSAEGDTRALPVVLRKARYDDEICLQLLVKAGPNTFKARPLEAPAPSPVAAPSPALVEPEAARFHDAATGLHNNAYLIKQLERLLGRAAHERQTAAVIRLDIPDLIGLTLARLGEATLPKVLSTIGETLKNAVAPEVILGRMDDTGFLFIAPRSNAEDAQRLGQALCSLIGRALVMPEGTLMFSAYAGIAFISETTNSLDHLQEHLNQALQQLHQERETQKALLAWVYQSPEEKSTGRSARQISALVQQALDQGRFRILFQPILSLRGSNKEYYEVLLRMIEKDSDEMSPADFFDVAAQMGAMTKIDRWVIMEAFKKLAAQRAKGHNTRLIINLSADSIKDSALVPWLNLALKAVKISPDCLLFQLNELDINAHLEQAKAFSASLAALGCECCVNHFGCALNPFSALNQITANYVKVDGSFTQELQTGSGEPQALGELVSQLHQREKITIVPFVENASVLSKLWQSGVHYIQGYYLQGPSETMDFNFDTEN